MTIKRRMRVLAPLVAVGLLVAGCGSSSSSSSSTTAQASNSSTTNGSASPVTLNVSAAASLMASFTTLGKQFEAANPNAKVVFNFAGLEHPGAADHPGVAVQRVRLGGHPDHGQGDRRRSTPR